LKDVASAQSASAVSYDFTKSENWRCFLIDVQTMAKIAKALDVSIGELIK